MCTIFHFFHSFSFLILSIFTDNMNIQWSRIGHICWIESHKNFTIVSTTGWVVMPHACKMNGEKAHPAGDFDSFIQEIKETDNKK